MPQPRIFGQEGYYDYTSLILAVKKYPNRLVLGAGGGILNSMIHETDPDDVTDEAQAKFREYALEMVENGAKVFGEMAALYLSMNPRDVFEQASPDHPLFLLLADIAAEKGVPIDIHMEAVEKDTYTPLNLRQVSLNNPTLLKANIPALKRLLKHNRKAAIVWQHIGWDNTGQMAIPLLRSMLANNPNLYLGFKIEEREYQAGTQDPMPNRIVDENNKIKPDWLEFFNEFQDRLLVSADQLVGIKSKTAPAPQYMEKTYSVVEQLPPGIRRKVAQENAKRIYHLE